MNQSQKPSSVSQVLRARPKRTRWFFQQPVVFMMCLVALSVFSAVLLYYTYLTQLSLRMDEVRSQKTEVAFEIASMIRGRLQSVAGDVRFLANDADLRDYVDGHQENVKHATLDFIAFSEAKRVYDQIRYLQKDGQESIRVNLTPGGATAVAADQLQNKANRYYFVDTMKLNPPSIYVSPLDLNVENGSIEEPHKPMIRFGTPVLNARGDKKGAIVINYLASNLLTLANQKGGGILNNQGYWLAGGPEDKRFAFMFGKQEGFFSAYPELWDQVRSRDRGFVDSAEGTVFFETVYPLAPYMHASSGRSHPGTPTEHELSSREFFWKVYVFRPASEQEAIRQEVLTTFLIIFAALVVVFAILSYIISMLFDKKIRAEYDQRHLQRLQGVFETSGAVCHEINQPLQAIMGYTDMMLSSVPEGSKEQARLALIRESAARIAAITGKLQGLTMYATRDYVGESKILDLEAAVDPELKNPDHEV